MKITELSGKKIAILGLGIEGLAVAKYFLAHGIPFTVFDEKSRGELQKQGDEWIRGLKKLQEKNITLVLGYQWNNETVNMFDVIVRSPGISLNKPFFSDFTGVITSQTKLFFDNCPAKIIGVTGTKGKGTTSALIYEMLKKAGKDAYLGGNIGRPPIEFLDTVTPQSIVVLELSSFQLQDMGKSPHIGIMLMVTQEHLASFGNQNYHHSIEDYINAKRNVIRFQTADDMAILNADYEATAGSKNIAKGKVAFVSRYSPVESGCFVENNDVILRWQGREERVISANDILLPGAHNLENVCAAVMAALAAGVDLEDIRFVLKTFKGLEHRLELVREVNDVRYYDDSFSTTPETAIAAIQAFTAPEIVILGGSSKKSDFTRLGEVIAEAENIKAIIGIGLEWKEIKSRIKNIELRIKIVEGLQTMEEIVQKAHDLAVPGDIVLLSPACASFDMFKNYKDRGNQFKEHVNLL